MVSKNGSKYSSIQQGIDAAAPGDTVLIKKGKYSENLTIEKDLTLKGQGPDKVIIRGHEKGKPALRIGPSTLPTSSELGKIEVEVRGIKLNGTKSADSFHGCAVKGFRCPHGLFLTGQARVELSNVAILSSEHSGVVLYDSAQASFRDVQISKNGKFGITLINSTQIKVEDSRIAENKLSGITLGDSSEGEIQNSLITQNKQGGVFLTIGSRAKIKGSRIIKNISETENLSEGLHVERSAKLELIDNEILGNDVGVKISSPENFDGKLGGKDNRIINNDINFTGVSTEAIDDLTA
ncbi:right-handed parallel beta-helix repeat-containing protein [Candidatus Bipolaricaulota bacterium]|nr:right-handed parallel beta-helix repeat-containing protein [Candidatus Bipolaricaulota bacterium]